MTTVATFDPADQVGRIDDALRERANPEIAEPMSKYMRHLFPFLGVRSPDVQAAMRPIGNAARVADGDAIIEFAQRCWRFETREHQYAGAWLCKRRAAKLDPTHLRALKALIESKSWWDTVDVLAPHGVGPLVRAFPELTADMDRWITDEVMWTRRAALLHQLTYGADTDQHRLFDYCLRSADDPDFFIRKASGWALRQYARTAPEAVADFVDANRTRLSALTRREALKHLS